MSTPLPLSKRRWMMSAAGLALVGALGAGIALGPSTPLQANTPAPVAAAAQTGLPTSFADIAEQVSDAVVNIQVSRSAGRGPVAERPADPRLDEFLERFGERFGLPDRREFENRPGPNRGGPNRGGRVAGVGSGFVIDPTGFIVTNDHVVGEADDIRVTMKNGDQFDATLIGRDPKTDLALLKVETSGDLPYVRFGDSDEARVGDWVIAVGNPFGLSHTVTVGVVSAHDRAIGAGGPYDEFLQIDASINRGNSGGPSFNTEGEVIGVNSAIFSPTGGSIGIGFAIPSNVAQRIIGELRENSSVERGWLGVSIQAVTPDLANSLGLDKAEGALVADVVAGSPAAEAGLQQGDVILSVDDTEIEELRDLPRVIAEIRPGQTADLVVWRDGTRLDVNASIGQSDEPVEVAAASPENDDGTLGLSLSRLDRDTRRDFGIDDDVTGVVITDVAPDSVAQEKGLRQGDVIVSVGKDDVTSPADVADGIRSAETDNRTSVLLLIARGDNQRFVALPLDEA